MSIIIDVVDRLIALFKRREEVSRATYDDVVKALMADVDALHRDYLTTFRKYRDEVARKAELDRAFLDTIAADSLFSRDLRARVRALVETETDPRLRPLTRAVQAYLKIAVVNPLQEWDSRMELELGAGPRTTHFRPLRQAAIDRRLLSALEGSRASFPFAYPREGSDEWGPDWDGENRLRVYLKSGVEHLLVQGLEPALAVRFAVRLIESLVTELQKRYAVITRAHGDVRTALLTPT